MILNNLTAFQMGDAAEQNVAQVGIAQLIIDMPAVLLPPHQIHLA